MDEFLEFLRALSLMLSIAKTACELYKRWKEHKR